MTSPLRAYIVDDERLAVERLERLLDATHRVDVVGSSIDPEEALAYLRTNPVDVLFLDIQMPGMTGFDLLAALDKDVRVIFTTAYDAYALEAFTVNSVDLTLAQLDARLDPRRFVRIHRATIVNVGFVHEVDAWVDGGVLVRLKDETKTELSVARDRVRELKARLGI
jgi:DNA-binding LytR/AlgR family response regulator